MQEQKYFTCLNCNFSGSFNSDKNVEQRTLKLTCPECDMIYNLTYSPMQCFHCDNNRLDKKQQIIINTNIDLQCVKCKKININYNLSCKRCNKPFRTYNKYHYNCSLCHITQYDHTIQCKICNKSIKCNECKTHKTVDNHIRNYCNICVNYSSINNLNYTDFSNIKRLMITFSPLFQTRVEYTCCSGNDSYFYKQVYIFPYTDKIGIHDMILNYLNKTIFSDNINDIPHEELFKIITYEVIDVKEEESFSNEINFHS